MKYLILMLSFFIPVVSIAAERVEIGAGLRSCGQYVEESKNQNASAVYISWTQGFLSAFNLALSHNGKAFVELPDPQSIKLYLDNYCQANPLKRPIDGSIHLFVEL